jgi:hypothetical protein
MLIVGSDDGVYRVTGLDEPDPDVTRGPETGRVRRGRDFEGLAGVFAATETGLYHSDDGDTSNLDVPGENVYAVGASPTATGSLRGPDPQTCTTPTWTARERPVVVSAVPDGGSR